MKAREIMTIMQGEELRSAYYRVYGDSAALPEDDEWDEYIDELLDTVVVESDAVWGVCREVSLDDVIYTHGVEHGYIDRPVEEVE